MPALESDLRRQLENVIIEARDVAEGAARSALQKRAVDAAEPFSHFGPKEKELRTRLRARGRQAGDIRNADKTQSIDQLSQELAYEFWHRMLFARFLAENNLLMHPDGVAVSLEECEELAKDADPPAPNGFVLAARYASTMLPQIFRTDDVLLEIDFAPEQRLALEKLLASLPQKTFHADDSLGWVYQFWQSKRKEEVNKSGDKIDGRTLSAVTQLFTEHYMVEFLLHNTIGAWWCAKEGIQGPASGAGIPAGKSPVEMPYLRWRDDGTPAAGKFEGWPNTLDNFTMLDPCCGSGHFLVATFNLLVPLRMHDEDLTAKQACDAVLRMNIFGLELDSRCTQIAAFALALAAWKYPYAGGYRPLPILNIACSGQGVTGRKEEWLALANGNDRVREGMDRLYELFQLAPHLGSLIDPRRDNGDLFEAGYAELQPLLSKALTKTATDADLASVGVAAQGLAHAAHILSAKYTLVATNVPYLGLTKQCDEIAAYVIAHHKEARSDLATVFVQRCLRLNQAHGSTALVTPQSWLFLETYKKIRESLLRNQTWNLVGRLGPAAFQDMNWWAAKTQLIVLSQNAPSPDDRIARVDVSDNRDPLQKAVLLLTAPVELFSQEAQQRNPSCMVNLDSQDTAAASRLSDYVASAKGICTGDSPRFVMKFWERERIDNGWSKFRSSVTETNFYSGCHDILFWENGGGKFIDFVKERLGGNTGAWVRGSEAWGKSGVAIARMRNLPVSLYLGELFDDNSGVLIPNDPSHLNALWAYCSSDEFRQAVRELNQKVSVDNTYLKAIAFDLEEWQDASTRCLPDGLPNPYSDDPTQWLFDGDIEASNNPLQVAVASRAIERQSR